MVTPLRTAVQCSFMRIQPEKGVKQGNSRLPAGTDSCYNTLLTYAQKQRSGKGGENMDIQEVRRLNGLQLAYIGDTIYDLFVRTEILAHHDESVNRLHRRAVERVNAGAQAKAFDRIESLLTEEEADVARRARNAHSHPPKNQNPGDYSRATALEALCGYLYLAGRMERLEELLNIILQEEEENHG